MRHAARPIGSGYSPDAGAPLLQYGNNDTRPAPAPLRQYIGASVLVFVTGGIYFYWLVFALVPTIFTDGVPQLGTPTTIAGGTGYLTTRYGWDWWCIWVLGAHAVLPMMLAYALANNKVDNWRRLHEFFCKLLMFATLVVFLILTWRWAFYTNTPYSGHSPGNDYRWPCVYFPSPWAPNNAPCIPNYTASDLVRNNEMLQHWVFSLVFIVTAAWHYNENGFLVELGVLE